MNATGSPEEFLERTTMRELIAIPDEAMDECLALAYQLYSQGRYAQAEVMCRGLVAADHRYWYPHALLAATLQKLGRFREALAEVDTGLRYEPGSTKLLAQRAQLVKLLEAVRAAAAQAAAVKAASGATASGAAASGPRNGHAGRAPATAEVR